LAGVERQSDVGRHRPIQMDSTRFHTTGRMFERDLQLAAPKKGEAGKSESATDVCNNHLVPGSSVGLINRLESHLLVCIYLER
jgi:hypothetical protein